MKHLLLLLSLAVTLSACSALRGEDIDTAPSSDLSAQTTPIGDDGDDDDDDGRQNDDAQSEAPAPGTQIADVGASVVSIGAGTTELRGSYEDTIFIVDAKGEKVILLFDGLNVQNTAAPCLFVRAAKEVRIVLGQGTTNSLSDGSSYTIADGTSSLDGVIFSKADLVISGEGKLTVSGKNKHGIVSKDDLSITSGSIEVEALSCALEGKDKVEISGGLLTLTAGSDGIRSTNAQDEGRGNVTISGGTIKIESGNDGIQAEKTLTVVGGRIDMESGKTMTSTESGKGLKGTTIALRGGQITITSKDDCIHAGGDIGIEGGVLTLTSDDDGIHADSTLCITGTAQIEITKSYEGLEAHHVQIMSGKIRLVASDDGINAADPEASGGGFGAPGGWGGMGSGSSDGTITVSGGELTILAGGDGFDANGTLEISGGNVTVMGPNQGDTAILDYDVGGIITGGTFIGTGASGMTSNFSTSSTQCAFMVRLSSARAGQTVTISKDGKILATLTPEYAFSCLIFSHADLNIGDTIEITVGTTKTQVTLTSTITGSGGWGGGMGGGPGGGWGGRPR